MCGHHMYWVSSDGPAVLFNGMRKTLRCGKKTATALALSNYARNFHSFISWAVREASFRRTKLPTFSLLAIIQNSANCMRVFLLKILYPMRSLCEKIELHKTRCDAVFSVRLIGSPGSPTARIFSIQNSQKSCAEVSVGNEIISTWNLMKFPFFELEC